MSSNLNAKTEARLKRKRRIRKKVMGTPQRPRLSVFRSAKHIYAQVIDDVAGKTIVAASSLEKAIKEHPVPQKDGKDALKGKVAVSDAVGNLIAQRLIEKGIKKVVFDRNGFLYHGRVRAVAESARKAGLDF